MKKIIVTLLSVCLISACGCPVIAADESIYYEDGSKYIGEINANGQPHGYGTYYKIMDSIFGDVEYRYYEGDFYQGQMSGIGEKYEIGVFGGMDYKEGLYRNGVFMLHLEKVHNNIHIQDWEMATDMDTVFFLDVPYMSSYGTLQKIDTAPLLLNDTTYIPLRVFVEALSGLVTWDSEQNKATIECNQNIAEFYLNRNEAKINGNDVYMSAPAQLINDRTMIP